MSMVECEWIRFNYALMISVYQQISAQGFWMLQTLILDIDRFQFGEAIIVCPTSPRFCKTQFRVQGQKRVCLKMLCTPLYPMVLLIIIPTKWLFHWGYTIFRHTQKRVLLYWHWRVFGVFGRFQHSDQWESDRSWQGTDQTIWPPETKPYDIIWCLRNLRNLLNSQVGHWFLNM